LSPNRIDRGEPRAGAGQKITPAERIDRGIENREILEAIRDLAMLTTSTAATAAVSTTSTTTAVSAAAAATATVRSLFARPGFIDGECAAHEIGAVECVRGRVGGLLALHGHEGKATGTTRSPIQHQVDFRDCPVLCKQVFEIVLGDIVGQVSDE
jgi:hypothetical protein